MHFGHGIRPAAEGESVIMKARSLEGHTQSRPYLFCHCWLLLIIILHCGQSCSSLKKICHMTCGKLGGVFFTPVKEVLCPPPCPVASMSLWLFSQMESQDSKISNNTLDQRDPQKSKECVFPGWMKDKREGSMFQKTSLWSPSVGSRCTTLPSNTSCS